MENHDFLPRRETAAADAADAETANVAGVVQRADLKLQRRLGIACGSRHPRQDRLEQRAHVGAWLIGIERRVAVQCGRVHDGKIELILVCPELVEQLERLVDDPLRSRAVAIDLVDDDDRLEALCQRLAGNETGLRHGALDRVDQEQDAVDHRQHALDLSAEIGVSGRIDDVDMGVAVLDRAVLGNDGDAALALDVVAVHDPLGDVLMRGKGPCLAQELVD